MNRSTKTINLTGQQLQHLQDRFGLVLDLTESGSAMVSRRQGTLTAETVAKMFGMKEIPINWIESEKGVKGL